MIIFGVLAVGFPLWAMQENGRDGDSVHQCTGDCYSGWRQATGGVVEVARASALARAEASPAELGEAAYAGCVACHGADGEGGVGPQLAGTPSNEIATALKMYRNGETRGPQSALMWSQAREMSDDDIDNLAAYIQTF
jgi:cytochrome c553